MDVSDDRGPELNIGGPMRRRQLIGRYCEPKSRLDRKGVRTEPCGSRNEGASGNLQEEPAAEHGHDLGSAEFVISIASHLPSNMALLRSKSSFSRQYYGRIGRGLLVIFFAG